MEKMTIDRVDARAKVTGAAKYSAEIQLPDLTYAVLVESTIGQGTIKNLATKKAEWAPGVIAVISHLNTPGVPEYKLPDQSKTQKQLKVFNDANIYFNGQPIAVVIADTLERAQYAASLVEVTYAKEIHISNLEANLARATAPKNAKANPKAFTADFVRGKAAAWKDAEFKLEEEYIQPSEVHHPMELHSIIANWEAEDKLTLVDKTQGSQQTAASIAKSFQLPVENVKVLATYVGGAFGSALRVWPHEIIAILAAKKVKKPVKLVLHRNQMSYMVGYRPHTIQKVAIGAAKDGKLLGISHESFGKTSMYEEFTENVLQMTRMMYDVPNIDTKYRIVPLNVSTPAPMRGPGEATGSFALECALDELSYQLDLDPIQLRIVNYAAEDPDKKLPWSSNYLKECYRLGAEKIGWNKRRPIAGSVQEGEWKIGYGMATGTFGAFRSAATVKAILNPDGSLLLQSAIADIGPGTATAMTAIAAEHIGLPVEKITFQLGNSSFPKAPMQGGSNSLATVGSATVAACTNLKLELAKRAAKQKPDWMNALPENVKIEGSLLVNTYDKPTKVNLSSLFESGATELIVEGSAAQGDEKNKYSFYSYSVHFIEAHVHELTGVVRIKNAVSVVDCGTVVSPKTARSQLMGGIVGGIGMALMEEAVIDDRSGRTVNASFGDYHVPVNADIPQMEMIFVNQKDPYLNPMGSKGLGEVVIIGVAPAVANAVYNATGKRVRHLPITPDKLI
ncbi:xanthine dehydrogenase family protein molybdopterin-binding subunit [Pedobacter sp. MC2016-14]|uniref:xanthine dehydrogenase family protein molybdopterin-binding subunit n=1 Tax=Pedobacter sp. MC2016-14 TaxID=2897327 RepID=UPI001E42D6CA|nr:xanthine dehydrogenase family protein molybdopterin-binding subunit [Pedobacter sp. MC2016-14]MCD0490320.1 xanthine dehydrogenase family protein molybdopterin-binding subunit [Pedobacter sp. MC2016-14]